VLAPVEHHIGVLAPVEHPIAILAPGVGILKVF
jgi:hypothetical protein